VSEVAVNSSTGVFLGGRYRLLEQIGRGSVGTVHRARDEFLGRDVAIKLIQPPVCWMPTICAATRMKSRCSLV
jgi:eukaryotic-like serine/threonine-protein kinase